MILITPNGLLHLTQGVEPGTIRLLALTRDLAHDILDEFESEAPLVDHPTGLQQLLEVEGPELGEVLADLLEDAGDTLLIDRIALDAPHFFLVAHLWAEGLKDRVDEREYPALATMRPQDIFREYGEAGLPWVLPWFRSTASNDLREAVSVCRKMLDPAYPEKHRILAPYFFSSLESAGPQTRQYSLRALQQQITHLPMSWYDRIERLANEEEADYVRRDAEKLFDEWNTHSETLEEVYECDGD